ncbi:MAG: ornithine carbamoyltransferase [Syntrophales bacterium LBB04]|nr:ornithine carbamoyltransferase [Syntrophales bacterium LBB04]
MKRNILTIYDLDRSQIDDILLQAYRLKKQEKNGETSHTLQGKSLGMIFDKPSTRTRISFEVGMYQLGGSVIYLNSKDTQLGRGESIADTAMIMSRYLSCLVIRTYNHETVEEFAKYATIPVINGLSDLHHPCQILSDLFTIMERRGGYEGMRIAYVGDGNNIANSWIDAAIRLPFYLSLSCPEGYDPDRGILGKGLEESEGRISLYRDPRIAVDKADVVYTDVWTSMGQESQHEIRSKLHLLSLHGAIILI